MKKRLLITPLLGLMAYVAIMGNAAGPAGVSAIDGTGASGSSSGCAGASCHSGGPTPAVSLNVQLLNGTTPVSQYIAGNAYTIRLTGVNTVATAAPRFGFQVAVNKTSTTTSAGTMTAIAGTHLTTVSGMSIIEHSPAALPPTTGTGGGGSSYVVDIPWTAPAAGTGTVSIRTVMNLVNNNGLADAGDRWRDMTISITEMSAGLLPITGTTTLCMYGTTTLSNATAGGTWSSSNLAVATVGAATGLVTGLVPGTAIITYDLSTMGYVTTTITVNQTPTAILGTASGCAGGTFTLTNMTAGGSWASSTPAVATVGMGTGVVTGVATGTSLISYSLATGCRTTRIVTINSAAAAGTLGGPSTVCVGNNATMTSTITGGTWNSSDPTKATVGATTGIVTGVAAGTATISYMTTNSCGTAYATKTVTVQPITTCTTLLPPIVAPIGWSLMIAPNPAKGVFAVTITANEYISVPVRITDLMGREVYSTKVSTNETTYISLLAPGTYLVDAQLSTGNVFRKLIIE